MLSLIAAFLAGICFVSWKKIKRVSKPYVEVVRSAAMTAEARGEEIVRERSKVVDLVPFDDEPVLPRRNVTVRVRDYALVEELDNKIQFLLDKHDAGKLSEEEGKLLLDLTSLKRRLNS
jgi:hypothetical protein